MQFDVDLLKTRTVGFERHFDHGILAECWRSNRWGWSVIFDSERGWRRQATVEEGHFGLYAHEHIVVGAIVVRLEEDVSAIVG